MAEPVRLFLCGDVMTGRGIDQALPHPSEPTLHEPFVKDAREYVTLAEEANGPIPRPIGFDHVWGAALDALEAEAPHAKLMNLETSITRSSQWEDKGINYRMHPDNLAVLQAAAPDACVLANNHVLDWGRPGLLETLETLDRAGLGRCGAGRDLEEARRPAAVALPGGGRLLVFAVATPSSGVSRAWAAAEGRPGVAWLPDLSPRRAREVAQWIGEHRRPGDLVTLSLHWGGNWGYEVPSEHRRFARALIEAAGVAVVHGHSSHHPLGIEVHEGRLVLYGCGDFVNDYEGISGHQEYQPDLRLMYFPDLDPGSGRLVALRMLPLRVRRFRLERAGHDQALWLSDVLTLEGQVLGTRVTLESEARLMLAWR